MKAVAKYEKKFTFDIHKCFLTFRKSALATHSAEVFLDRKAKRKLMKISIAVRICVFPPEVCSLPIRSI